MLVVRQRLDTTARATLAAKIPLAIATCAKPALESATEILRLQHPPIHTSDPIFAVEIVAAVQPITDCLRSASGISVESHDAQRFAIVNGPDRFELLEHERWLIVGANAGELASYPAVRGTASSIAQLLAGLDRTAYGGVVANTDLTDLMFGAPMTSGAATLIRDRGQLYLEGWIELGDSRSAEKAATTLRDMWSEATATTRTTRVELRANVSRLADYLPIE